MKCCVCGREIFGPNANNPEPYMSGGVCCDECNLKYVIPARIAKLRETLGENPGKAEA